MQTLQHAHEGESGFCCFRGATAVAVVKLNSPSITIKQTKAERNFIFYWKKK